MSCQQEVISSFSGIRAKIFPLSAVEENGLDCAAMWGCRTWHKRVWNMKNKLKTSSENWTNAVMSKYQTTKLRAIWLKDSVRHKISMMPTSPLTTFLQTKRLNLAMKRRTFLLKHFLTKRTFQMHWCHEVEPYKDRLLCEMRLMMALVVIKSNL